ncbi:MAG: Hsp20 family protein [Nitrososphaeraceae archaeon]
MTQTQHLQRLVDNWIGFDQFLNVPTTKQNQSFPPFDITKEGDNYKIVVALAGYTTEDVVITTIEDKIVIESSKQVEQTSSSEVEYIRKGIAKRSFKLSFNITSDILVDSANLINGMLTINMHREVPESKLPRLIRIES